MSVAPPLSSSSSAYDPSQLQQSQQVTPVNLSASTSYSSTNLSPGIIITVLILSVTVILTTSLCLLFRHFHRLPDFLSLRGHGHRHHDDHSSDSSSESLSRHLSHRPPAVPSPGAANQLLIDSLPLFSFSSVTRRANAAGTTTTSASSTVVDADCAVCLSRFVSHDTLRLLPFCCHAFHSKCIDTWLSSGHNTCPLCRSNVDAAVVPTASILRPPSSSISPNGSFRLEIGSVIRHRNDSVSDGRRSYSMGSFDYMVEADSEVTVTDQHSRSISDKDDGSIIATSTTTATTNNNNDLAAELNADIGTTRGGGSRSWLGEYIDRLSATLSSRTASFRGSRRFFTGSSRRSEVADVGEWDIEASRVGEEISELFRWASGV
ncbi:hypothetical protein MLD38_037454 [Melastoma candidum]|uniref:Uncharacterized protein n=1 Tax=Melastoma candidum TaxID=119954 RepID=A0ACB9LN43_9MYRT|nr:hypothetical protein MLD38_037454 [Melastoma candidum]